MLGVSVINLVLAPKFCGILGDRVFSYPFVAFPPNRLSFFQVVVEEV